MLLLRAGDRLSERSVHRLDRVFAHDDPTGEIGAAWGVKERVRMLLACTDLDAADTARGQLGITVLAADMPETWRLWETINDWWDEIETFIETRVTNARTEAANTDIKHIKRTGRGYRNHHHYQRRILLRSHRQTRRASKHLRVLREVGLVRVRGAGKQRLCGLDARGLRPVHEWVGGFERFWNESFDRLDTYVQDLKQTRQEE
jgi:hypothetical protein